MGYTRPTILIESKAANLIIASHEKRDVEVDSNPLFGKNELPAYEADE